MIAGCGVTHAQDLLVNTLHAVRLLLKPSVLTGLLRHPALTRVQASRAMQLEPPSALRLLVQDTLAVCGCA
jgi:hypothetical protein